MKTAGSCPSLLTKMNYKHFNLQKIPKLCNIKFADDRRFPRPGRCCNVKGARFAWPGGFENLMVDFGDSSCNFWMVGEFHEMWKRNG